ncbi:MAG: hypothetical protein WC261_08420 [Synergistaceae bacterium]
MIDWKTVGECLKAHCSAVGIASKLGVSTDTLYLRCRQDNNIDFTTFSEQKKAEGVVLIEESIYKDALTKGGTDRMQKLQPDITIERNGQPYRKNIKETAAA